ncbi:MAG TPA: response regulator transcription factor [Rubrivivax sp.]|nr:response regulator transcription factor [Rubrivivax sp.]
MTLHATTTSPTARLLLVDDHTIVREGLKRILGSTEEGWDITEESSGFQALDSLRRARFDLAIVDLSMPGMSGLELIHRIRTEFPPLPVLVLSMHAEEEYALRAFKAGANGYVTKDSAAEELLQAVRKVLHGGAYVTASLAERVVQQLNGSVEVPRHAKLSNRELEVLRRIVVGERSTDIAEALHLSVKTISTHKTRIMEKLQLGSTAALVRYAIEHRLHGEAPPAPGLDDLQDEGGDGSGQGAPD